MIEDAKYLSESEKDALVEIKSRVSALFPVERYILFGSKARGDAWPDSDVDLLILTTRELRHGERHIISHEITDVNRRFGTLFSFITIARQEWDSKRYSFMPIHETITNEGIFV